MSQEHVQFPIGVYVTLQPQPLFNLAHGLTYQEKIGDITKGVHLFCQQIKRQICNARYSLIALVATLIGKVVTVATTIVTTSRRQIQLSNTTKARPSIAT